MGLFMLVSEFSTDLCLFQLGLACMLALGLFVTLTQAFRIFTIANLKSYTDSFAIVVWSIIEINVGVSVSTSSSLLRYQRKLTRLTTDLPRLHPILRASLPLRPQEAHHFGQQELPAKVRTRHQHRPELLQRRAIQAQSLRPHRRRRRERGEHLARRKGHQDHDGVEAGVRGEGRERSLGHQLESISRLNKRGLASLLPLSLSLSSFSRWKENTIGDFYTRLFGIVGSAALSCFCLFVVTAMALFLLMALGLVFFSFTLLRCEIALPVSFSLFEYPLKFLSCTFWTAKAQNEANLFLFSIFFFTTATRYVTATTLVPGSSSVHGGS